MTTPILTAPTSFSATADLAADDCTHLDRLSAAQRAELEAGHDYIRTINLGSERRKFEPLPKDFRVKVAAYCEAKMTRKTGIPAAVT
jgi:hypothetical protein